MSAQNELRNLVKIKGVGKTMSKSLSSQQLNQCNDLLQDTSTHLATKTTLLVAFIMLENTPEEQLWFDNLKTNYKNALPKECHFLFDHSTPTNEPLLLNCIYNVLQTKNLTKTQLDLCCNKILSPTTPSHYKAALLEGLRLKEESKQENKFFLTHFYDRCTRYKINTPTLIDIASAYDGFNRYPNMLISLAALLGSAGFPTIIHGCKEVSPKFGITPHNCLIEANKNPLYSLKDVQSKLENPSISWGYIDQSIYFPEFHDLVQCRSDIVKRPVLATVEKFMQPFFANNTYIITGYTHPPYRQKTIDLLRTLPNCTDFLFVRGIEGSALAPIDRRCPLIYSQHNQKNIVEAFSSPEDYNIKKESSIIPDTSLSLIHI